jgi:uncharacterized protein (DUF1697 family)
VFQYVTYLCIGADKQIHSGFGPEFRREDTAMPLFIALFRGVNMAGHKKLAMSDLRTLAEHIGFAKVQTLLQSGNLIFSAASKSPTVLEATLERELAKRLKLATTALVRTAADWKAVVSANPFPGEARRDPSHLAVIFLKDKPSAKNLAALKSSLTGPEYFEARGRELYAFYPEDFARSKFTTALIDRKLDTIGTGRNWNTVLKLAKAVELET